MFLLLNEYQDYDSSMQRIVLNTHDNRSWLWIEVEKSQKEF